MGVDMANQSSLIGFKMTVEETREHIGADSLAYLSLAGMMRAVVPQKRPGCGHCSACFSGEYPLELDLAALSGETEKLSFESMWGQGA